MLAAVLLSQHRFGDAIAEANKAMAADPRDAWNYGAAGDGYLELGDYPRAFEAFDRMGQLQPGPAGLRAHRLRARDQRRPRRRARVHAARRRGHLAERSGITGLALRADRRSAVAARPRAAGAHRIRARRRDVPRASHGDRRPGAHQDDRRRSQGRAPDAAVAAGEDARRPIWRCAVGDLSSAIGDATTADQYYQMAEQIERAAWGNGRRQPQVLAQDPERAAGPGGGSGRARRRSGAQRAPTS